jgi:subtilisin family serine protease
MKPDLLAPGERILSCASRQSFIRQAEEDGIEPEAARGRSTALYKQDTGTSMAAPHVSGAIAAFMSARSELIGEPMMIKSVLMESASDLGRKRDFQGAGLIDLMRAMQAQTLRKEHRYD